MKYVIMRPSEAKRELRKAEEEKEEAAGSEKPKRADFASGKEFFAALTKWRYKNNNKD